MLGVVAGVLTVFMSLLGCIAAALQSRPALCCYICVFFTVWCIQVAAAAAVLGYSQQLTINYSTPSSQLTSYSDVQINNAVLSVYQRCCTGCPRNVVPCNNPYYDTYVNGTLPYCTGAANTCKFVTPCTQSVQGNCFIYRGNDPYIIPPYSPDQSVCNVLSVLSTTNPSGQTVKLVDYASKGGCGGGDPTVFLRNLSTYLSSHLVGVFVVFILIICTESIALPFGFYLIITGGSRSKLKDTSFLGVSGSGGGAASGAVADEQQGSLKGGEQGIAMV